jgi:hypothetical protein
MQAHIEVVRLDSFEASSGTSVDPSVENGCDGRTLGSGPGVEHDFAFPVRILKVLSVAPAKEKVIVVGCGLGQSKSAGL